MRASRLPSKQESRIEWWRRLIVRQQSSTIPLTQFCREMGINTRKFYYWRQRLREMDGSSRACQVSPPGSPRLSGAVAPDAAAAFVPVSIVDRSATTAVEIELANGCSVRLTGIIDPALLHAAIVAASELETRGRGDH
jgi:transposase-like protein